jgi:hypothetical protein
MVDGAVDLDGCRSPEGRMEAALCRDTQQGGPCDRTDSAALDLALGAQMLAGPADTWVEVAAKIDFLLGQLALTAEGQDERIRKLTQRALSDIARLAKREERNR